MIVRGVAFGLLCLLVAGCSSTYRTGQDLIDDFDRHYDYVADRYFTEPSRLNRHHRKRRSKRRKSRRNAKKYAAGKRGKTSARRTVKKPVRVARASIKKQAHDPDAPAQDASKAAKASAIRKGLRPSVDPSVTPQSRPKRFAKLADPALANAARDVSPAPPASAPKVPLASQRTPGESGLNCPTGNSICEAKLATLLADGSRGWITVAPKAQDYVSGARLIAYGRMSGSLTCQQIASGLGEARTAMLALGTAIADESALKRPTGRLTATRRIAIRVRDRLAAQEDARC